MFPNSFHLNKSLQKSTNNNASALEPQRGISKKNEELQGKSPHLAHGSPRGMNFAANAPTAVNQPTSYQHLNSGSPNSQTAFQSPRSNFLPTTAAVTPSNLKQQHSSAAAPKMSTNPPNPNSLNASRVAALSQSMQTMETSGKALFPSSTSRPAQIGTSSLRISNSNVKEPPLATMSQSKINTVDIRGGSAIKRKRSKSSSDDEEDEEEDEDNDLEDDESSEDDGDEEDDSIVAPDSEIDYNDELIEVDETKDLEAAVKELKQEAQNFMGEISGKRKRTAVSDPYAKIIAQAYEQDEKKELIKELKIWKKTLSKEASDANVVWPNLKPSMDYSFVKDQHEIVRKKLGLDSSDDELESEEEENSVDDETLDSEEINEEDMSDSSSDDSTSFSSNESESENE